MRRPQFSRTVIRGLELLASSASAGGCGDLFGHPYGCAEKCQEWSDVLRALAWIDSISEPASSRVVLNLSRLEAKGLHALAGEGAEGILTDPAAAAAYVGNRAAQEAAERALRHLTDEVHKARA